jgi:hypothetical protein
MKTSRIQPLPRPGRKAPIPVVKDDWDDDDEDDEPPMNAEESKHAWETAYVRFAVFTFHECAFIVVRNSSAPMPQIVSALPSTSAPSVPVVATALLNQPTMKILKRPMSSSPASSTASPPPASEPLADRQARYEAARQKIFGSPSPSSGSPTGSGNASPNPSRPASSSEKKSIPNSVRVAREPRGPSSPPSGPTSPIAKGFSGRRAPPPKTTST